VNHVRKHLEVSMGTGETIVELTNCDLVLSGAGITFYSAFVYVTLRNQLQADYGRPWNKIPKCFLFCSLSIFSCSFACVFVAFVFLYHPAMQTLDGMRDTI